MNTLRKLNWRMWEYLLLITGWLFGYGHEAYYGVKANRNMAYFKYKFPERKEKR